jgi:hypothetical protein
MSKLTRLLAALALVGVTSGVPSDAADQALSGKKLLIKNPPAGATANKVVYLAKDPSVVVGAAGGAGDPQCSGAGGGGAILRVRASGGSGEVTLPLPCGGWTTNAANTRYVYKDPTGATCKILVVKRGVLAKAVCKGAQMAIDVSGGMAPVTVIATLNTQQYCSEFGGTSVKNGSNEVTFLHKDAAAPPGCPAPAACYIGGTLHGSGTSNSENACQSCQPTVSLGSWTNVANGTACNGQDICIQGTCLGCPYAGPPLVDPSSLPQCAPACGGAHCLAASLLPDSQQPLLAPCDAGGAAGVCAPDPLIAALGDVVPQSCVSFAGAEGRCLSTCMALVGTQGDLLPTAGCAVDERCAPCYNPIAADPTAATGACTLACDAPNQPPVILACPWEGPDVFDPSGFPSCAPACAGSHCAPKSLVPAGQQSLYASCDGGDGICAPDPVIRTGDNFVPQSCTSIGGAEGRCLSTCLPFVQAQAGVWPIDVCATGERCAPCYNPTAADPTASTGACNLACDAPTQDPVILECPWSGPDVISPSSLPACSPACGGSHCAPKSLVPAGEQSLFASCDGGDGICAPDPVIRTFDNFVPKSCNSIAGAEGRCLSTCLPLVQAQELLPASGCAADERCAPCYDPTAADPNAPTGACTLACDAPTRDPVILACPWSGPDVINPSSLPACSPACGGSHCAPKSLVPAGQQSLFASCDGGDGICAPDPIIRTFDNFVPKSCHSIGGVEGRCLSTCLPFVQAQAGVWPIDVCATGEICAPCWDPGNPTTQTGACSFGCDQPKTPPPG